MPQQPPIGDIAKKVTDAAFRTTVEIDLDSFYNRMLAAARQALKEFQQQGLTGDALAKAVRARLMELSNGPLEMMGRASTSEAFNLGRNITAQERASDIKEAVRTEVLDSRTCSPCRKLDGAVVEFNSEEYFKLMPPSQCNGRDFCRGFYLMRSKSA